ncbi:hypothetical protein [Clostridium botulinum]|nr:hypothetical protein [Clostridium botulinum]MBN3361665.1 hypothetical protein [Clostridium botulinum]
MNKLLIKITSVKWLAAVIMTILFAIIEIKNTISNNVFWLYVRKY